MTTYRSNIAEKSTQVGDDTVYILSSIYEPMSFAVCHLPDDVERKELKPLSKITYLPCLSKQLVSLVKKDLDRFVD